MIEPVPYGDGGVNRVRTICDECLREETIPCNYVMARGKARVPDEGQAKRKLTGQGWAIIKGKLFCPSCEAKRKAKPKMELVKTVEAAPTEPTKAQKRAIWDMLNEVYDTDAERYLGSETDASVASALEVMAGWVTQIREDSFGPAGSNDAMDALAARLSRAEETLAGIERDAIEVTETAKRMKAQADGQKAAIGEMRAALAAITKAVGGHVRARAGLKG